MTPVELGLLIFAILLFVIMMGIPVAFSLGLVALVGMSIFLGGPQAALPALAQISWSSIAHFTLCTVPLFILMSEIINISGMSEGLFNFTSKWLSRLPGGLAVATVCACGIFGAICGSSVATAATIGTVTIPEMRRRGYKAELAFGATAAGGTLGILIPPSIPMIVYGTITENSIGRLFAAGILPGIFLSLLFSAGIVSHVLLSPSLAPLEKTESGWAEKFRSIQGIWPVLLLIAAVLGSIYGGIATPSEAAGLGCVIAVILAKFYYRKLDMTKLKNACLNTAKTTAMVGMIIVGAMLFGYLMSALKVPQSIINVISSSKISPWHIIIGINLILLFLGCFLEAISIIVITAPTIVPIIVALGFDPVWFGVVMTINMELALITPPVGLNLFIIGGIQPDAHMVTIIRGVLPFIVLAALFLGVVIAFPEISLWLPKLFYGK